MSRFTLAPFPVTSGELMLAAGMARSRPTRAEGREVLDEVHTEAVAAVPRDLLWPSMIWAVAEATQAVGHADMAGAVYDAARPFGWLTVVNPGGVYLGSMEHHLACSPPPPETTESPTGTSTPPSRPTGWRAPASGSIAARPNGPRSNSGWAVGAPICLGCGVRVHGGHHPREDPR